MIVKLIDIITHLEDLAPLQLQEAYDNCGLQIGDKNAEIRAALVTLDCTESVVDEAIGLDCNLIVAHHPVIFKPIKRITGETDQERVLIKAIQHNIAIYIAHTNLDHIKTGVNARLGQVIGLKNIKVLEPKKLWLKKLVTFCPKNQLEAVRQALFSAGAGAIGNYNECSFSTDGEGTFTPNALANPFIGKTGIRHTEVESRLEVVYSAEKEQKVLKALFTSHPYEEVAYDCIQLTLPSKDVGAGMVGELNRQMTEEEFVTHLKDVLNLPVIRHTNLRHQLVSRVAICGGSGSFLLQAAIQEGADWFLTGDVKYHEFFNAEGKIVLADIGHYESEQYTKALLSDVLKEKFPIFAVHLSKTNTNPINYS